MKKLITITSLIFFCSCQQIFDGLNEKVLVEGTMNLSKGLESNLENKAIVGAWRSDQETLELSELLYLSHSDLVESKLDEELKLMSKKQLEDMQNLTICQEEENIFQVTSVDYQLVFMLNQDFEYQVNLIGHLNLGDEVVECLYSDTPYDLFSPALSGTYQRLGSLIYLEQEGIILRFEKSDNSLILSTVD